MTTVSGRNFGYLIAFVLPGTLMLLAIAVGSPEAKAWLMAIATPPEGGTVGGFLYLTLAAIGAGLTASTIRWAAMDPVHHATGVKRPVWDDSQLQAKLGAFNAVVENHYRFAQFYGNSLVGLVAILIARR